MAHEQEYRRALEVAAAAAGRYLDGVADRPVRAEYDAAELHAALDGPLPEEPEAADAVLEALAAYGEAGTVATQSPRFFGFVVGGAQPTALAADWLVSAWDQNAGLAALAPFATAAERVAAGWVADLLGLPEEMSFAFTTGGQMANWTCLAAARQRVLEQAGWDLGRDGLAGAPPVRVVAGAERHGTVDRALRFLGFGTAALVEVPADGQGRMRADALGDALDGHDGPTIVVAQAGNVNTGAFDPFADVVEAAHRAGAWLHVDGAFGLWARASERRRHLADGVEHADSWCVDAHKWLNVPYDCGLAFTRHPAAHRAAVGASGSYLAPAADAAADPLNWTPEQSRRARGVPVWAVLRALGRTGVATLVDRLCDRAAELARLLTPVWGVKLCNDVELNQVLLRFVAADTDGQTRSVVDRVQREGTCFPTATTWQGQAALRLSVSNWATSPDDVEASVDALVRCAGLHR